MDAEVGRNELLVCRGNENRVGGGGFQKVQGALVEPPPPRAGVGAAAVGEAVGEAEAEHCDRERKVV